MTALIPFYGNRNHSMAPRKETLTDSFFDDPFFRGFMGATDIMRVDVADGENAYTMEVDLPGVKAEDLDIAVEDSVLTISAEMNTEKRESKKNYLFNERRVGTFVRRFNLEGIDENAISADFDNGVLTLTLPKLQPTEAAGAKKIEVNVKA